MMELSQKPKPMNGMEETAATLKMTPAGGGAAAAWISCGVTVGRGGKRRGGSKERRG